MRGKIYGLLQSTQPLGYMTGLLVATLLGSIIFIPSASPNVVSTVYDIALPEVRIPPLFLSP